MSKIDYQALREVAEKATPGNWWIDSHGQAMVSFIDNEVLEVFATDNKRDAVRHEDTGNLSRWRNDNDATFIATANPATVLALLDELERNQQYIKHRDQENEDIALTVGKLRVELEAEKKRIAELEAEPVSQTYKLNELSGNSPVTPDGWISCSERMPNDKQYVWCWGKSYGWTECDTFEGYYDWSRNKWWAVTDDGEEPASKVTHWMPLPEPPQEVNDAAS
ncbi:TPA: DUF551 domain-containing protein [Escherichia coli]|nr:DUF551 domain-containing protein [Escherichia coli]